MTRFQELVDRTIPFGIGKRQCAGEGQARTELFIGLVTLVHVSSIPSSLRYSIFSEFPYSSSSWSDHRPRTDHHECSFPKTSEFPSRDYLIVRGFIHDNHYIPLLFYQGLMISSRINSLFIIQ